MEAGSIKSDRRGFILQASCQCGREAAQAVWGVGSAGPDPCGVLIQRKASA
jgi:hypothetical protein